MHSSNKGRSWAILGGILGGIVLVAVIAIVLILSTFTVSTDDYRESYNAISDLRDALNDQSSVDISSYATATELENDTEKLKTAYGEVAAAYTALYDTKAAKRDSDAKGKLDVITQKYGKYLAYTDAEIEALEQIMPVVISLNDLSASSLNYDSFLDKIQSIRNTMNDLDLIESVNSDYRDQVVKAIDDYIVAYKAYVTMRTNGEYDSVTTSAYYDSADSLTNADKHWRSNLEKLADEGDISKEVNALGQYLTAKANGA